MRTATNSLAWLGAVLVLGLGSLRADEKLGMPDLSQVDQTCLPTATANLIVWFGRHGYPKLILSGATAEERELHTVHRIMDDTHARFDFGTRMDAVTDGIQRYIHAAGYECEVEYRGLDGDGPAFTQNWLQGNDDPNKGFVLLLAYGRWDAASGTFTPSWKTGHAVTLVNAKPDLLLIHDPDHNEDEPGRKILTPHPLENATFVDPSGSRSASGLLLLSGSLLEAPPDSQVLLIGAVGITLHPPGEPRKASSAMAAAPPAKNSDAAWWRWLTGLLF